MIAIATNGSSVDVMDVSAPFAPPAGMGVYAFASAPEAYIPGCKGADGNVYLAWDAGSDAAAAAKELAVKY